MPASGPRDWIVAFAPPAGTASADGEGLEVLDALAGGGRVLLTGPGLGWLGAPSALRRLRERSAQIAVCSQSAREAGWSADRTPEGVAWSSLARWMVDLQGRPFASFLG